MASGLAGVTEHRSELKLHGFADSENALPVLAGQQFDKVIFDGSQSALR